MIERGKDAPLAAQAIHHRIGIHAALDEFDGYLFAVRAVGPAPEIDHGHAAAADFAIDAPRAQHEPGASLIGHDAGGLRLEGAQQVRFLARVVGEQLEDFLTQLRVVPTRVPQKRIAFAGGLGQCLVEQRVNAGPTIRR
jgi:hypothetical protein